MKTKRRKQGKPKGATYADVLAYERAKKEAIEKAAAEAVVEARDNIYFQRALWLMVCSMADAFEIGPKRAEKFFQCLQANSEELERMQREVDDDYAFEKLRRRAEEVVGRDIRYIYEEGSGLKLEIM